MTHELVYYIKADRFQFIDDNLIRYHKEERDVRENVNFRKLRKYVKKVLSTLNGYESDYCDFTIDKESYHIILEKNNL